DGPGILGECLRSQSKEDDGPHPFPGERQVQRSIAVEIRPNGVRHHSYVAEIVGSHIHEYAVIVSQEQALRARAIVLRDDSSADVSGATDAPFLMESRQPPAREGAVSLMDIEAVEEGLRIAPPLVSGADDVEVEVAIAIRIQEGGIYILIEAVSPPQGIGCADKFTRRRLKQQGRRLPFRTPDEKVIQPVTVHIADGQRGALRGNSVRD